MDVSFLVVNDVNINQDFNHAGRSESPDLLHGELCVSGDEVNGVKEALRSVLAIGNRQSYRMLPSISKRHEPIGGSVLHQRVPHHRDQTDD